MPNKKHDGIHQKKENQRKNILLHRQRHLRKQNKTPHPKTKSNQIPRQHRKHTKKIRILGQTPPNQIKSFRAKEFGLFELN